MVKRAEQLADTLPDSTVRLIDSVLRMPASFSERERMDMALLQAEALFGDHGQEISPVMDDDFFDEHANLSTSPELERAAAYYAGKKQYAKAAHAALYSGFVQQHYNEKEAAMRSFKEAEQYGKLAIDSLTVAQAQFKMGKMLLDTGMKQEALAMLQTAHSNFGNRFVDKALTQNILSVCYLLQGDFDNAETYLHQSLLDMEISQSEVNKLNRKIWNNYAVLYRIQGKHDQAIDCLYRMMEDSGLDENEIFMSSLNLGNVFFDIKEMDSAAKYYQHIEDIMPTVNLKKETIASAYSALSRFAEKQNDAVLALQYREKHEKILYDLMLQQQEQTIYRTLQQYDYESLQNEMNRKLIQRQHVITFFGVLTIIGLIALAVSQIRLAKTRKQEAETNANLFHFMQQNKSLVESNMSQERKVLDATQQLSDMYFAKFKTMQKLSFSIENPKNKIALKELEKAVFGDGEHWDGVIDVLDVLYPGLWESITFKYPEMEEMERRVFILSRFKLSRMEEAALLGISTSVLDKLRTRVHKIVEQEKKQ